MDADTAYKLANFLLPDDGPLAVYNAVVELHTDRLTPADAEAAAEADDDAASLAAVIGHGGLGGGQFSYYKVFAKNLPEEALIKLAVDACLALPSGTIEEEAVEEYELGFPKTTAVMAVWQKRDGKLWTIFYRHPDVAAGLAAAILKDIVSDFKLDERGHPASGDGSPN